MRSRIRASAYRHSLSRQRGAARENRAITDLVGLAFGDVEAVSGCRSQCAENCSRARPTARRRCRRLRRGRPNKARLVNVTDWRHSDDLVRNPRKDGGGIGRGGFAIGVRGCRSGARRSRSRHLRQRALGIRIRMRRRARMGRLESGSQLGPARRGQECMVPVEPARSLAGWSTRRSLFLKSLEFPRE